MGGFGRLTASGIHNRDRITLNELRCRVHQDGVGLERHRVRITPEVGLRERWRILATLPPAALNERYATHGDDELFLELGRIRWQPHLDQGDPGPLDPIFERLAVIHGGPVAEAIACHEEVDRKSIDHEDALALLRANLRPGAS